ncbi:MAG: protein-disulfide reductase DsbD [Neisseria sp.]|uniref:protein-disulfide reductase DsbD n=1 Tax=Neisseria sp. TaxID=192066 RepID=UPI0026DC9804|nr:protein-disulfide reductase DsbD [Neisseria sp.]MDO4641987.1 protein-disulfide reductase DsbD [Neisseria sp.]
MKPICALRKFLGCLIVFLSLAPAAYAVDASKLLPPEQAFVPQVDVSDKGVNVEFNIADGYYLYQSRIQADTGNAGLLGEPQFSKGQEKEDEFFGKQTVFHQHAQVVWPYKQAGAHSGYTLKLTYQGCADVGVCYPPVENVFEIKGNGLYQPDNVPPANGKDRFLKPSSGQNDATQPQGQNSHPFNLSRETLGANLLAFFIAGLGFSFTACMYPLLPIVSGIVVGDKQVGKGRAFSLSMVYVQGLALTYTVVGLIAGLTGSLLTVWLQQAWVVLTAAGLLVVLALSMFGLFNIQLPAALQSYFQNQSNKLSGGRLASVFGMGMLSALIVGPCVAPPLVGALAYIGKTGDAVLGGLALYALALGTGVPLILVGTFGGHVLPRAGAWMNGIKYAFGIILLAAALYIARPFLPYAVVVVLYSLLLIIPAGMLLVRVMHTDGLMRQLSAVLGGVLLLGGLWFGFQSYSNKTTALHEFLTLYPDMEKGGLHSEKFTNVEELKAAMNMALQEKPNEPVLLDFYADWCVSCKEMEAKTLNQPEVGKAVDMSRFFQINVTANTPEQQELLKEYGLYGPPGIFVVKSGGHRSEALLGFVQADEFIEWVRHNS